MVFISIFLYIHYVEDIKIYARICLCAARARTVLIKPKIDLKVAFATLMWAAIQSPCQGFVQPVNFPVINSAPGAEAAAAEMMMSNFQQQQTPAAAVYDSYANIATWPTCATDSRFANQKEAADYLEWLRGEACKQWGEFLAAGFLPADQQAYAVNSGQGCGRWYELKTRLFVPDYPYCNSVISFIFGCKCFDCIVF